MAAALGAPAALHAEALPDSAPVLRPGATMIGPTAAAKQIWVSIVLPSRDPAGAAGFATHVSTPGNALYRQYLLPAQFAARYGADPADYEAVRAWAVSQGLEIGEVYAARTVLPVRGTAAQVGHALGVTFNDYKNTQGQVFYAADGDAKMPAALAGKLDTVVGLSSEAHFKPLARLKPAVGAPMESGTGPGAAFLAADLRAAYGVPPQYFTSKTQTLAVFEQGGFDPGDIATYEARNKLPAVPVRVRGVNGYGGGVDDPGVEVEAVIDIDMQIGINPAAKQILVYEDGLSDSFQAALLNSLSAMASDDKADAISISYGQDETLQGHKAAGAENTVLTQMAAQGQAVFASSGDDGAYGDGALPLNVSDPASQPKITGVGGTTLFTGPKETYFAEETWNDLNIGAGATGGGVSAFWKIPGYQDQGYPVATQNGGSDSYRNVPDVAAVGNPLTGIAIYSKMNGGWLTFGGTSVSAPIWASFYSLVNAASEGLGFAPSGFANPAIYKVATTFGLFYPDFNDVADGSNGDPTVFGIAGFEAGYGYDNTTGWGSFDGLNMIAELALLPIRANKNPPPAPTGLRATETPTSVTLTWTPVAGARGYLVAGYNYRTFATVVATLQKGTTLDVSGLKAGGTYLFQVLSISAGGYDPSAPIIVSTPSSSG